jgi:hypothetical protein
MKINDIYKNMKNLIRNILKEKVSTKSKQLIYETERELDERGRPRLYSDEEILSRACQYTNQRDFEKGNDKNYFYLAKNRKLLPTIRLQCNYVPLGNAYSRMLYMYIWEKNVSAVYFGLTCDEERRYEEHTRLEQQILNNADVKPSCKVGSNSAVKEFIKKNGIHDRYVMISDGYIDAVQAALAERCLIDHFKNDDEWKGKIEVVNKSKGGELGGRCPANARRMAQDVKLIMDNQINTPEEFQLNYPVEYEYWSRDKNRQRIINQGLKKRFFSDAPYSKEEILNIVSNYDNLDEFKNENRRAFLSAKRNKMIEILYPEDNVYFNPNTNKTYESLISLNKDLNKNFKDLYNDFLRGQGELDYGIITKKKNEINENILRRIIKEETEEINQKVMNFLLRRHEINEINIDDQIKFKEVYFKVGDDYYGISMWDSKKRQVRLILNMLEENNVIEPIDNFSNENDPYRQKVVRTIKKFLSEIM